MTNLETRLKRLEAMQNGGTGRMIIAFSRGCSDAVFDAAMHRQGIEIGPNDGLLHVRTVYEDRNGEAMPDSQEPHFTISPLWKI